jgi:branched-chain amino acid transport system permease protein
MPLFLEQLLNGLATGSIYALVTMGLALVYGIMRILHVAHAAATIAPRDSLFQLGGSLCWPSSARLRPGGVAVDVSSTFPAEMPPPCP